MIGSQILLKKKTKNKKKNFLACVILCSAFPLDLKAAQKSERVSVERDVCVVRLLGSLIELS